MAPKYAHEKLHAETLEYAQQAPQYLKEHSTMLQIAPSPLLAAPESAERWNGYEQLIVYCLQSGDDKSAHMCLERLVGRFGRSNERVKSLQGMYYEAVARASPDLENILKEYEKTLLENPTNGPVAKRRITLLRNLGRDEEAVKALNELLDLSPVDAEAWAELSELYLRMSLYQQAIFCLEEVLLIVPNAWSVHARLGEILCILAASEMTSTDPAGYGQVVAALKRFCRSVELCDGYLRGWCGVKMAADQLLKRFSEDEPSLITISTFSIKTLSGLRKKAHNALSGIITQGQGSLTSKEIYAARQILDQ